MRGLTRIIRYRELVRNLVAKDLKVKYRGSVLGLLWSLLNPLAMIVVYSLAFQYILRIPLENYPLFLITGIIPWNFFSGAVIASSEAIIGNANLLKKVKFPLEILPFATILFNFVQLLFALLVFFPAVFWFKTGVTPLILLYLPVLALQFLFTLGVAFFLSSITPRYRDVRHLTEVALMVLFWLTPIIYSISMVPGKLQPLIKANPLTAFITVYQDIIYWGRLPSTEMLISMVLWTGLSLGVGYSLFRRRQRVFVEEL
jgi:ABC-type polysaccharide/polyol phosphate export permease